MAPIVFCFVFFVLGIESNDEQASDNIIAAEFKNESIEGHEIFERRGFKTDVITVNDIKYLLNQDTVPNRLIKDLKNYTVSKKSGSNSIELESKEEKIVLQLWEYDKFKYWRNRLIWSLLAAAFFSIIGFLNYRNSTKLS